MFEKLDINGAGKAFFEAALAWDLEIDGKKWVDGKAVSSGSVRSYNARVANVPLQFK